MNQAPRWFKVVAVLALLWNLLGCAAYLSDVMMTPEAAAKLSPAQQELYESRPAWAVGATATAVWFGALGSLGLVLRKAWSAVPLVISLVGVVIQNYWLFFASNAATITGSAAFMIQGLVLLISIALVLLAVHASKRGWLA